MNGQRITAYLGADEWRLIQALRELPESTLRARLWELLVELTDFVREPRCPEVQADGVPCASAQASCDQCAQVTDLLERLRGGLRPPQQDLRLRPRS
jgi:hypothetical protein